MSFPWHRIRQVAISPWLLLVFWADSGALAASPAAAAVLKDAALLIQSEALLLPHSGAAAALQGTSSLLTESSHTQALLRGEARAPPSAGVATHKVGAQLALLARSFEGAQGGLRAASAPPATAAGAAGRELPRKYLYLIIGIESFILFVTLGLPLVLWILAYTIGRLVKEGIETLDKLVIGTDVEIESLQANIFQGILSVEGLHVKNPPGKGWESPYLLKAGRVHIDLDMCTLLLSFFRHVEIEKLDFKDVDVIYEKGRGGSNASEVMNFIQGTSAKDKNKHKGRKVNITLHQVLVQDVGARVQAQILGGRGMRVSVGDISYADFAAEYGDSSVGPVIQILLKSVLKTVIVNIAGKQVGEHCL